ncbi:hypothetical protein [Haloarcula amylovorans]|uniref:hypothetical protein n=1 Tax=Haloarcula amylovorans TaxID=2562280 RepID=UPI001075F869|nr:hypothetical protein [Halomicroarcula amylolytica]
MRARTARAIDRSYQSRATGQPDRAASAQAAFGPSAARTERALGAGVPKGRARSTANAVRRRGSGVGPGERDAPYKADTAALLVD